MGLPGCSYYNYKQFIHVYIYIYKIIHFSSNINDESKQEGLSCIWYLITSFLLLIEAWVEILWMQLLFYTISIFVLTFLQSYVPGYRWRENTGLEATATFLPQHFKKILSNPIIASPSQETVIILALELKKISVTTSISISFISLRWHFPTLLC